MPMVTEQPGTKSRIYNPGLLTSNLCRTQRALQHLLSRIRPDPLLNLRRGTAHCIPFEEFAQPRHAAPALLACLRLIAAFLIWQQSQSIPDRLFSNSYPSGTVSSKQFIFKFNSPFHFIAVRAICMHGEGVLKKKKIFTMANPVENNSGKTEFPNTAVPMYISVCIRVHVQDFLYKTNPPEQVEIISLGGF